MGYIYTIINKINGKQYIGKTEDTIEERWKKHCKDSKKERCEKRPLYNAFNKYGIENFEIKEIEYIKEGGKLLSDREEYWINYLNTYGNNGYNATKGGDGSTLYDYAEILKTYAEVKSIKKTSEKIGCCIDTVKKVLNINKIDMEKRRSCNVPKIIEQYSLEGELLNTFPSCYQAGKYLKSIIVTPSSVEKLIDRIHRCATGQRKTAYKYIWKFKN